MVISPYGQAAQARRGLQNRSPALRLARESRSTQAATCALHIDPKRIYQGQRQAQASLPADPTEAAEVRQLRAANRRLEQKMEILKKAIAIAQLPHAHFPFHLLDELLAV